MKRAFIAVPFALFAVVLEAAVGDYVRNEIRNYNGYDGLTLVTWTHLSEKHNGRAWAVKADLSKGFRLKAKLGVNEGTSATVGAMAEEILREGEQPVVGINGDYFSMDEMRQGKRAVPVGFVISDSKLVHPGSEAFTSKWQSDWVPGRWYIMETADHKLVHAVPDQAGDWSGKDRPAHSWDVTVGGKKIRNALETNWCNYPVRNGQINIIGNCQDRNVYPRVLVGLGKTEEGNDMAVFFLNDGRHHEWSDGVTDVDSAQMMIDEGCTEVGEFDGGGSASMWVPSGPDSVYPRDTTASGGYLNQASDGAPRLDATGLFLLAPKDRGNPVAKIGDNPYDTLAEANLALAPGETIKPFGDVPWDGRENKSARRTSWFAADTNGTAVGGAWSVLSTSNALFVAARSKGVCVSEAVTVTSKDAASEAELEKRLAAFEAGPVPQGAVTLGLPRVGHDLVWSALVREDGRLVWKTLNGPAARGVAMVVTMELDFRTGSPRVSYLVGASAAEEPTRLYDDKGVCWFDGAGSGLRSSGRIEIVGEGVVSSVFGYGYSPCGLLIGLY